MASAQYSVDLFLDWVRVGAMFLEDGKIVIVDYDTMGRRHESGDLIYLEHEPDGSEQGSSEQNTLISYEELEKNAAVVLGWGESEAAAIEVSKAYIRRIAKWHGEDGEIELNICGHDFTQSQLFQDILKEDQESSRETEEINVVDL